MVTFMAPKTPTQIRIRPETRHEIDRICQERGWTITEAIDRIVRKFQAKEEKDQPDESTAAA
jgi:hypothetical protein